MVKSAYIFTYNINFSTKRNGSAIMKKSMFLAMLMCAFYSAQAADLFYTDFHTTPAGFKAASDTATAQVTAGVAGDDTLTGGQTGITADTIDGCILTSYNSGAIVISKGTQSYIKVGDIAGCTTGRLSIKNAKSSITMPKVAGPCAITYYAASSSATVGRGITFQVNGTAVAEGGISELTIAGQTTAGTDTNYQATRKMTYNYTGADSVTFTLLSAGGGVYLYDIRIDSGNVTVKNITDFSAAKKIRNIQISGNIIKNDKNQSIDIFNIAGVKVMTSNKSAIDLKCFSSGIYMARIAGTNENIKIIR